MKLIIIILTIIPFLNHHLCEDVNKIFDDVNREYLNMNRMASRLQWNISVNPPDIPFLMRAGQFQQERLLWDQATCSKLADLQYRGLLNETQKRMTFLLCKGPKYSFENLIALNTHLFALSKYPDAQICIPANHEVDKSNFTDVEKSIEEYMVAIGKVGGVTDPKEIVQVAAKMAVNEKLDPKDKEVLCIDGEEEMNNLMKKIRDPNILLWIWTTWREKVAGMKDTYHAAVEVMNTVARKKGYNNMGESWREDLEIPNLRKFVKSLYNNVQSFYVLLHGVVRFYLRKTYGDEVPERGPIPAHLLGNLWGENWEALADMILPSIDLDQSLKNLNWTVLDMTKRADDFYRSMGLPPMSDTFWKGSVFSKQGHQGPTCHGQAGDLYDHGDYKLLYCAGTTSWDFYVLHHEMGHIQYYIAYEGQPGIFRQANSAFHEAVGDAVYYGVVTPEHLYRLGLINDSTLYTTDKSRRNPDIEDIRTYFESSEEDNDSDEDIYEYISPRCRPYPFSFKYNRRSWSRFIYDVETFDETKASTDIILLLKQALFKIPQIPFGLLLDEYRWRYFEGAIADDRINADFWMLARAFQGIAPPNDRGEMYFDAGAKFHVPDNTPYIRYFLSSFIQHQLFEALCKASVFGRRNYPKPLPDRILIHRCDIYGSKPAGKLLGDFMAKGYSEHWRQILKEMTGDDDITSDALMNYYRPLMDFLRTLVRKYKIPLGWY